MSIAAILARGPVIPVLTVENAAIAGDLARALLDGGVDVFEVTLRTEGAFAAFAAMRRAAPAAAIGIGTLRDPADVARAAAEGADFGVSPGCTPALLAAAAAAGLPFLPGVQTASEVLAAREAGLRHLKLFPAMVAGGLGWLDAMAPVFADIRFCPTGGIGAAEAPAFLARPNVACVGGSWLAPRALVAAGDWAAITALARAARALRP
jgi:2-dehydro-3-deoxyphosphogluconate aldolase/(4S)-4-hydroxy-2-oxoglutarate aldolase